VAPKITGQERKRKIYIKKVVLKAETAGFHRGLKGKKGWVERGRTALFKSRGKEGNETYLRPLIENKPCHRTRRENPLSSALSMRVQVDRRAKYRSCPSYRNIYLLKSEEGPQAGGKPILSRRREDGSPKTTERIQEKKARGEKNT